jgi:hypothetical protein
MTHYPVKNVKEVADNSRLKEDKTIGGHSLVWQGQNHLFLAP